MIYHWNVHEKPFPKSDYMIPFAQKMSLGYAFEDYQNKIMQPCWMHICTAGSTAFFYYQLKSSNAYPRVIV